MPSNWAGQMITFAAEVDPDATYRRYIWIRALRNDTIKKIAARRGHPEMAADILTLNKGRDVLPHPKRQPGHKPPPIPKLRSITNVLRFNVPLRIPGVLKPGEYLHVNADDKPPVIKAGYAKYDVVDVPGRLGISRFLGYDPIAIDVPIRFENYAAQQGATIETNIQILERLAGRGDYPGAAFGPPAVVRVSVTDNNGNTIPLIPPDYQWSHQHQNAPLFRISAIAWDDQDVHRTAVGYRVRQTAVVTLTQYTPLTFVQRSVAQRTLTIPSKTTKSTKK